MDFKKTATIQLLLLLPFFYSFGQKPIKLNDFPRKDIFYHAGVNKPTGRFNYMQIAQKLDVPSPGAFLESITLNRLIVSTSDSSFNQTKFRVGIYNKDDQTGGPGKELNIQIIEIENKLSENIEVNLKPYKIELTAGDFFVVITYTKDTYNERFTKMTADSIILKNVISNPFRLIASYQPFIAMSPIKGAEVKTWARDPSGKWTIYDYFAPELTDFAISAKISMR
ncbi:hypothetical protein [Pedobacter foliorum]|uniref:hypothetical protein n=1 Tax=Pedobacter foliorum TaxID=2739058 RepID=UPI001567A586|nr:hypothetical protein [Pedobacter foliorum]NRF39128.1 hypothetical protein [Pedobacter foliorum]